MFGKITAAAHRMSDVSALLGILCISEACFSHNDPVKTEYRLNIWLIT